MRQTIDFALGGGWHVTLFHPWAWLTLAVVVLLLAGAVVKLALAR